MLATAETIYRIAFTTVDTIVFLIFEVYIAIFLGEIAVFRIVLEVVTTPFTFFKLAPEPPIYPHKDILQIDILKWLKASN